MLLRHIKSNKLNPVKREEEKYSEQKEEEREGDNERYNTPRVNHQDNQESFNLGHSRSNYSTKEQIDYDIKHKSVPFSASYVGKSPLFNQPSYKNTPPKKYTNAELETQKQEFNKSIEKYSWLKITLESAKE